MSTEGNPLGYVLRTSCTLLCTAVYTGRMRFFIGQLISAGSIIPEREARSREMPYISRSFDEHTPYPSVSTITNCQYTECRIQRTRGYCVEGVAEAGTLDFVNGREFSRASTRK